ncbi:MAG TPA: hypothetical protein VGG28_12335, partial [Kofleriaceae bacterium]
RELDIATIEPGAFVPALGRLRVSVDRSAVHVVYEPATGAASARSLTLPALPDERVQLVAYVAANMIRDQASELLAQLHAPPIVIIDQQPPSATPPAILPPPRIVDDSFSGTVAIDAPVEVEIPATIGFVPPLEVDRLVGAHVIVGAGLHALVGSTDGSRYISVAGLADIEHQFASGLQLAGIAAIAGRVDGVQAGGIASVAHDVHGMQLGGIANVASRVDGMQLGGIANVAGDVHGMQVGGIVNLADDLHGVQLGLVNISSGDDDAYPIGLINYSRTAGVAIDGWAESTGLAALALRHGPRHLHNVWSLGWSPNFDHALVGAGLGTTLRIAGRMGIDIDALHWWTSLFTGSSNMLNQLRATLAIPLGPIDLLAGAAANIYVGDGMDEKIGFSPTLARTLSNASATEVVGWPSLFVGVRVHAR